MLQSTIVVIKGVLFGIAEKWDPRPGTFGGTNLIGGTQDPRPGTLKVGPKTRDPGPNS